MHLYKHNRFSIFSIVVCLTLLVSCIFFAAKNTHDGKMITQTTDTLHSFDDYTHQLFCSELTGNTINLHFTLSNPENYGITNPAISLGSLSEKSILESYAQIENILSILNTFDYHALTEEQKLTYDILEDYFQTELSSSDFLYYEEPLRPSTGIHAQLPVLFEEYKFYDKQDIEDYLSLIPLTYSYFSQMIEYEQKKSKEGLFMSDFACEEIIEQCESFISDPDGHYLIETFNKKIDQMDSLSSEQANAYKIRNESLVKEQVLPAYQMLAASLKELLGSGTNDKGLCHFPEGKNFYEYLVYYNTGCSADIKDIQKMTEEQRTADLKNAAILVENDPNLIQKCNSVSLTSADPAAILETLETKMNTHFPQSPDIGFTVNYIDECMEDYMAPAFYITPPIDDYSNNSIFINASADSSTMRYFTTLAHEGFPGHLYQTVMSYEADLAPIRCILNYPGYVEGWATYAEMISYQYAGLEEQVAELLMLNQSALLSLYASTDLGIHYEGWSFEDTLNFWSKYGITDQEVLRDVYELIIEEPAHYLKYYVGYLEFLNLKEYAKEYFNSNYSDISFHRAVLSIGPAPFDILKRYLPNYYVP